MKFVMYCVDLFVSNKRLIKAYPISVRFNEFEPCLKSAKNRFQFSIKRRLKSLSNEYNFKWNQPYLSRGLNLSRGSKSLNFNSHSPRVGSGWLKLKNLCPENPSINQKIKSANWSTIKNGGLKINC